MNWDYITGFFDADGSITAVSHGKGKNKSIQVSFHNNEMSILEEIKQFILKDINIIGTISKKISKNENHQDAYDLKYSFRNGLAVANKLISIHPKKLHRIKIYNLIQEKTKRNGKYTEQELLEREELVIQFFKH
jgi:intein/homing endonuclease